jgi:hypothetical protein
MKHLYWKKLQLCGYSKINNTCDNLHCSEAEFWRWGWKGCTWDKFEFNVEGLYEKVREALCIKTH